MGNWELPIPDHAQDGVWPVTPEGTFLSWIVRLLWLFHDFFNARRAKKTDDEFWKAVVNEGGFNMTYRERASCERRTDERRVDKLLVLCAPERRVNADRRSGQDRRSGREASHSLSELRQFGAPAG